MAVRRVLSILLIACATITNSFKCPDLKTPKCSCELQTGKSPYNVITEDRGIIDCSSTSLDEIFLDDYSQIMIEANPLCQDDMMDGQGLRHSESSNEVNTSRRRRSPKLKERQVNIGSMGPSSCTLGKLTLNRTSIAKLTEGHFPNLYIEQLRLVHNVDLISIEEGAFNLSRKTLRLLDITNGKMSIHQAVSFAATFERLEKFKILLGFQVVDKFTFSRHDFKNLRELDLSDNGLSKVGDFAFYEMPNLRVLRLTGNNLHSLTGQTLTLGPPNPKLTQVKISILLNNNRLSTDTIDPKSLSNFLRPTILDLSGNNLHSLPERPFRTFLYMDAKNSIDVKNNPFLCDSDDVKWIRSHVLFLNYSRGGLDEDVNPEYRTEVVGDLTFLYERTKPDYSFYKIRDMMCPDGRNVFAFIDGN